MTMRKKWILLAPLALAIFITVGGQVVQQLWNWLAPELFGWRQITFWQALGLLALCRILFGGFGCSRGMDRPRSRRRLAERWEQMTPEEREKFQLGMRSPCGGWESPASGPKEPA